MTQLAQDTKTATLGEVVTAIQQRSAALGELLKEAAANENNPDALKAILEKLDGTPAATAVSPSSGVRPHEQFKLEVFDSKFGQGVRFVQPAGMTLRTMMDLINVDSRNSYGRDAIYRGNLLKDGGIDTPATENIVHEFTPVVQGSENRSRGGQKDYMEAKGMSFTDRPLITIAAGLFRLEKGFPANNADIGTERDKGDLLQGKVVRARSGALASDVYGLGAYDYWDDLASHRVVAAGSPNQKS